MKKLLVLAVCLGLFGCSTYMRSLAWDAADATYVAAAAYYQLNKASMSVEDQAKWEKYLLGFQLTLDTGKGVEGYAQRWYQFLQGW